jgi:signal transduction histidine kinase
VSLRVIDNGKGISTADLARALDPLVRLHLLTRPASGTGTRVTIHPPDHG